MQSHPFYALLGQRIQLLRQKKGFTQKQLADIAKLSRTSITNIEKGRQKVLAHTLFELASALDAKVAELFPEKGVVGAFISETIQKLPKNEKTWVMKIKSKGLMT